MAALISSATALLALVNQISIIIRPQTVFRYSEFDVDSTFLSLANSFGGNRLIRLSLDLTASGINSTGCVELMSHE